MLAMKITQEFREFISRGNVIDLAVGVIIGAAFGKIVNSLVADVIMPPIGAAMKGVDFSGLFVSLDGKTYATLALAKEAGAPVIGPEPRGCRRHPRRDAGPRLTAR